MDALEKALSIYGDTIASIMASPGKGAERAVAIIVALNANKDIPWDRVSKFEIEWDLRSGEYFPKMNMEFHKSAN